MRALPKALPSYLSMRVSESRAKWHRSALQSCHARPSSWLNAAVSLESCCVPLTRLEQRLYPGLRHVVSFELLEDCIAKLSTASWYCSAFGCIIGDFIYICTVSVKFSAGEHEAYLSTAAQQLGLRSSSSDLPEHGRAGEGSSLEGEAWGAAYHG